MLKYTTLLQLRKRFKNRIGFLSCKDFTIIRTSKTDRVLISFGELFFSEYCTKKRVIE